MKIGTVKARSSLPFLAFLLPAAVVFFVLIWRSEWTLLAAYVKYTAVALLLLFSFISAGHLLLYRFRIASFSVLDYLLASLIAGMAVVYLLLLLFGLAGIFLPVPIILTITAFASVGLFQFRNLLDRIVEEKVILTRIDTLLLMFASLLAGIQLVCGWSPLIFHDFLYYHLYAPAEFLKVGSFIELPMNFNTHSPLAMQLTLASSLVFDSTGQAFKLLANLLGILMAVSAALFLKDSSLKATLLTSIFVLSLPAFWIPQTLGTIDLPVAAFIILGVRWFYDFQETKSYPHLLLAGLAFGLTTGSRYQAIVLISVSLLVTALFVLHRRISRWKNIVLSTCIAAIFVLAMTLPWLIRNFIQTGNPFFPLLYEIFGGSGWSMAQAEQLLRISTRASFGDLSVAQKILAPFHLVLRPADMGLLGIGSFITAVLCLFSKKVGIQGKLAALIGLAGMVIWGIIHPQPGSTLLRFNAATALFLLASAGSLIAVRKHRVIISILLVLPSLVLAGRSMAKTFPLPEMLTDMGTRNGFQKANIPAWEAFEYVNQKMDPARHKLLLIGETRGFISAIPCINPSFLNGPQLKQLFLPAADSSVWGKKLKTMGITHMIVCLPEWKRLLPHDYLQLDIEHQKKFLEWVRMQKPLYDNGKGTFLIELRD